MASRPGILIVNLGSPDAPTPRAVRRFLDEFLGDPMVVDVNPVLWWLLRKSIILPFRGRSSAQLYRRIWTPQGSPLLAISKRLAAGVARQLAGEAEVVLAMRYGNPSLHAGLEELRARGCTEIHVIPLFAQASQTTTGTIQREVERLWEAAGTPGTLRFVDPYFAHPAYLEPQAGLIRAELDCGPVDHVILSFHGLPVRYVQNGDPYQAHCEATAAALAAQLELAPGSWTLAYQSRFGREPWLEPATSDVAEELGKQGGRVLVACPGFLTDCLETIDEIDRELRREFESAGGTELRVVPCLNDSEAWVRGVARLLQEATGASVGA